MTPDCRLCPKCQIFKPLSDYVSRSPNTLCRLCRVDALIIEAERQINRPEYAQNYKQSYKAFIYLIVSPTGIFKIGRSVDIDGRIKSLNYPGLKLHHCFYTWHSTIHEKLLHDVFKDKQVEREWFNLNEQDVELLIEIGRRVGREKMSDEYITKADKQRLIAIVNQRILEDKRNRRVQKFQSRPLTPTPRRKK